jgi:MscS family membrane protein
MIPNEILLMPTNQHRRRSSLPILSVLFVVVIQLSHADSAQAWQHQEPADTSSPRATLKSFIDACNETYQIIQGDHYFKREQPENRATARRILDCIDDSGVPEFERSGRSAEVAVCIKEILDRVELPPYDEIPDAEEIEREEDGLDRWQIPGTRLTIARIAEGPRKHEYLFSAGTVERATEYFQDMKGMSYSFASCPRSFR